MYVLAICFLPEGLWFTCIHRTSTWSWGESLRYLTILFCHTVHVLLFSYVGKVTTFSTTSSNQDNRVNRECIPSVS